MVEDVVGNWVDVEDVVGNCVVVEVVGEKLVLEVEVEVDVVVGVTHGSHGLDLEQGSKQHSPEGSGCMKKVAI